MKKLFKLALLSTLSFSTLAGVTLPITAKVISYNETRVKVKFESEVKHIDLNDLTRLEEADLDKHLGKNYEFQLLESQLQDPKKLK